MRFRWFIRGLLSIITLACVFSGAATWKKQQIEQEVVKRYFSDTSQVDYAKVAKKAREMYGESNPVWKIFWLKFTYNDLCKYAVTKGADMRGGRITLVGVNQEALIEKFAEAKEEDFKKILDKTREILANKDKANNYTDFIDCFAAMAKQHSSNKALGEYFKPNNEAKITHNDSESQIKKKLRDYGNNQLKNCKGTIQKRVDPAGQSGFGINSKGDDKVEIEAPYTEENEELKRLIELPGKFSMAGVVKKPISLWEKVMRSIDEADEKINSNSINYSNIIGSISQEDKEIFEKYVGPHLKENEKLVFSKDSKNGNINFFVIYNKYECDDLKVNEAKGVTATASSGLMNQGKALINIEMSQTSYDKLANMTKRYLDEVKLHREGHFLVTMLDGEVISSPSLKESFSVGTKPAFSITGIPDLKEAKETAAIMASSVLPVPLKILSEEVIGASLGEQAQSDAFFAFLVALVLILLFIFLYYAVAGIIANAALAFNMIYIVGTLGWLQAYLTLPGIAGIILTIGMAVDANVLIFERIREYLRLGTPPKEAIAMGYTKAFRSIFDANLTTLIVGLILFFFSGISPIISFASTLIIGIISSFVTAVILSRFMIELLVRYLGAHKISFSFVSGSKLLPSFHFDFLKKRKWAYLISCLFLASGSALFFYQKIDLGLEFTGGQEYLIRFGGKVNKEELNKKVSKSLEKASTTQKGVLRIRPISSSNKHGQSFKIATNYKAKDIQALVQQGIKAAGYTFEESSEATLGEKEYTIESTTKVDADMAGETQFYALLIIVMALLAMLTYIFFSFHSLSMAFAALMALIHDAGALFSSLMLLKLTFGTSYPLDQAFISTLLTVIGYSINDTVVIFDRIRESMKEKNTNALGEVANNAIQNTLSRTLITSFTTLMPVTILYFMGGVALESFAFCLLSGILFGTYSSIFIATPLAYDIDRLITKLKQRKQQAKTKPTARKTTSRSKVIPL